VRVLGVLPTSRSREPFARMPPVDTSTIGKAATASPTFDAITRLLDIGALKTAYTTSTPAMLDAKVTVGELVRYIATPFGSALLLYLTEQMGFQSPEVVAWQKARQGEAINGDVVPSGGDVEAVT